MPEPGTLLSRLRLFIAIVCGFLVPLHVHAKKQLTLPNAFQTAFLKSAVFVLTDIFSLQKS